MSGQVFYGTGARGISEPHHLRFPRQSSTSGNWETRTRPHRPLWKDFAAGIIGGLVIIPPLCLYVAPYAFAALRAIAE